MTLELDRKDVSRLISQGQDSELPPEQRERMHLHLMICQICRHVDEQFAFLRRARRWRPAPADDCSS